MTATEILKHEHQIILLVLKGAERENEWIQQTGSVRVERIEELVDFFRSFADGCHHRKEEALLFVRMQERGLPLEGGPIPVMLAEHDEGRRLVRGVAEALPRAQEGQPEAVAAVRDFLGAYVGFLRAHINKEDNVLFPMADQLFSAEDQEALAAAFDQIEAEEIGEGVHEKYHQWAHEFVD